MKNEKCNQAPFTYADLECLIERINACKNNPEKQCTTKVGKHILSRFPMYIIPSVKNLQNYHSTYRAKDCS